MGVSAGGLNGRRERLPEKPIAGSGTGGVACLAKWTIWGTVHPFGDTGGYLLYVCWCRTEGVAVCVVGKSSDIERHSKILFSPRKSAETRGPQAVKTILLLKIVFP